MQFRRSVLSLSSIVLLVAVWAGTGAAGHSEESRGVLRVLTSNFAPFFFLDEEGQPTGLEQKILASFAEDHDLELEVIWVEAHP